MDTFRSIKMNGVEFFDIRSFYEHLKSKKFPDIYFSRMSEFRVLCGRMNMHSRVIFVETNLPKIKCGIKIISETHQDRFKWIGADQEATFVVIYSHGLIKFYFINSVDLAEINFKNVHYEIRDEMKMYYDWINKIGKFGESKFDEVIFSGKNGIVKVENFEFFKNFQVKDEDDMNNINIFMRNVDGKICFFEAYDEYYTDILWVEDSCVDNRFHIEFFRVKRGQNKNSVRIEKLPYIDLDYDLHYRYLFRGKYKLEIYHPDIILQNKNFDGIDPDVKKLLSM